MWCGAVCCVVECCVELKYIVLHCIVLYCNVLYCIFILSISHLITIHSTTIVTTSCITCLYDIQSTSFTIQFLFASSLSFIVPVITIRQLLFFRVFFFTKRSVRIAKSVILRQHSCSETVRQKKKRFFLTGRTHSYDRHNIIIFIIAYYYSILLGFHFSFKFLIKFLISHLIILYLISSFLILFNPPLSCILLSKQSRKPLHQSFNGESNSINVSSMSFSRDDSSKGDHLTGFTGILCG